MYKSVRSRNHVILRYNSGIEVFEIKAIEPFYLNNDFIQSERGFITLKLFDKLHFECHSCFIPHIYYFIPAITESVEFKETIGVQQQKYPQSEVMSTYNAQSSNIYFK